MSQAEDCFHLIIIYLSSNKRLLKLQVPNLPMLPWLSGGAARETVWDALGRRQDTFEGDVMGLVGWERTSPSTHCLQWLLCSHHAGELQIQVSPPNHPVALTEGL